MGIVHIGCKTCNKRHHCDSMTQFECLKADFRYYSPDYSTSEPAQIKSGYKAFNFTGRPSTITKELNEFFVENPQAEIVKVVEIEDCATEESGIVMIVREN